MASFLRFLARRPVTVAAALASSATATPWRRGGGEETTTYCEAAPAPAPEVMRHQNNIKNSSSMNRNVDKKNENNSNNIDNNNDINNSNNDDNAEGTNDDAVDHHNQATIRKAGFQDNAAGYFYDLIPRSQLFQPKFAYPMWDDDWDDLEPPGSANETLERRRKRYIRKHGVTRHIILVRHGQYDETHKEDEKRILTAMGREQAHMTGKRLAAMMQGVQNDTNSPCRVKVVHVSTMARAKETANIIASHLSSIDRSEPNPLLNEGRPAHTLPSGGKVGNSTIEKTAEHHPRIETAFRQLFYRAPLTVDMPEDDYFLNPPSFEEKKSGDDIPPPPPVQQQQHEFEIVVCHANVIRYFLCRALQLPPEAWLRFCTFNCSLTYLTIRPTGSVSCRLLGDIGHLPPALISFSGHHGFNW